MQTEATIRLLDLPERCLENIASHVPQRDRLGALRRVCHRFYEIITSNSTLWNKIVIHNELDLLVAQRRALPLHLVTDLRICPTKGRDSKKVVSLDYLSHFIRLKKLTVSNVRSTASLPVCSSDLIDLKIKNCPDIRSIEVHVPSISLEKLVFTHCMLDNDKLPHCLNRMESNALRHLRFGFLSSDIDPDTKQTFKNPGPAFLSFIGTKFPKLETLKITTNIITLWDLVPLSKACPNLFMLTVRVNEEDYVSSTTILEKAKSFRIAGWKDIQFSNLKVAQFYGLNSAAFEIRDFLSWTPNLEIFTINWNDNPSDFTREMPGSLVTAFDCNPKIQHFYRTRNRFIALSMPLEDAKEEWYRVLRHTDPEFFEDLGSEQSLISSGIIKPPAEGVVHCDKQSKTWQAIPPIMGVK